MSKFWGFVGIVLVTGVIGVFAATSTQEINFTDLETECREDRGEEAQVTVENNRLIYSGYFPVQSTEANMRYNYERSGDQITLNVKAVNDGEPENFETNCYATGVYEASTTPLNGEYKVETLHNGERVDNRIIEFK